MASAEVVDPDLPLIPGIAEVESASVIRIADRDRIGTAIEAAQTRSDWGFRVEGWNIWQCSGGDATNWLYNGSLAFLPLGTVIEVPAITTPDQKDRVECTVVKGPDRYSGIDIIIARSDDYSDALAATPLADVRDAPVLINPTATLDPRNAAEIARLAAGRDRVVVHLLGGTNALSAAVETAIDAIPGVDVTSRLQGIDRYETATNIARVTVEHYGIESGASLENVNAYVTTGINFPDALAAGAAAAANDGVVLLTKGEALDSRGFTEDFLIDLNDWVNDTDPILFHRIDINTTETFAVGGPAHRALVANDIRFVEAYDGADRYETATLAAEDTFGDPSFFAVVSGMNYPDAVVASAYIANADGPLLLSAPDALTPVTAAYLADNV
ncbi:MAG: cell wall-binding repeat-containing protein, partial [Actinobacteria bacterium]|nr:cell wall-binding repeat-containing protein [Actinomycetota bacterium]